MYFFRPQHFCHYILIWTEAAFSQIGMTRLSLGGNNSGNHNPSTFSESILMSNTLLVCDFTCNVIELVCLLLTTEHISKCWTWCTILGTTLMPSQHCRVSTPKNVDQHNKDFHFWDLCKYLTVSQDQRFVYLQSLQVMLYHQILYKRYRSFARFSWARGAIVIAIYINTPLRSFFRSDMVRSWQTDRYLFLRHFYRYEKAQDVPEVFVSYVSTWSYVGIKRIPVGPNGFRLNLWIFLEKFPWWIFSVFPKIFTDKPQYDTFLDYCIIKNVTAILIAG